MSETLRERFELPTSQSEVDPTDPALLVLGGGYTYSKKMLAPLAEVFNRFPNVKDVAPWSLLDILDNPDGFQKLVRQERAWVVGHSAAALAMKDKRALPVGARRIDYIGAAELKNGEKPHAIAEEVFGAGKLAAVQVGKGIGLNREITTKRERRAHLRAVGNKGSELIMHPRYLNPKLLRGIGHTSALQVLESVQDAEAERGMPQDQRAALLDVIIRGDQFGFGLSEQKKAEAAARGIEVVELTEPWLDHESITVMPKRVVPLIYGHSK